MECDEPSRAEAESNHVELSRAESVGLSLVRWEGTTAASPNESQAHIGGELLGLADVIASAPVSVCFG
ncbi:MAG: hypothetical protein A07HR60_01629 [uncultured archaeon A07HR60]|nr:MAG: hypothetical protein A07HR60_01629 [uncultured archaeon A07HR60]